MKNKSAFSRSSRFTPKNKTNQINLDNANVSIAIMVGGKKVATFTKVRPSKVAAKVPSPIDLATLRVGAVVETKEAEVLTFIRKEEDGRMFPYIFSGNHAYSQKGMYFSEPSKYDIVKIVSNPPAPKKKVVKKKEINLSTLKVGQKVVMKGGGEMTFTGHSANETYPYLFDEVYGYTQTGRYSIASPSDYDIMRIIPLPQKKVVKKEKINLSTLKKGDKAITREGQEVVFRGVCKKLKQQGHEDYYEFSNLGRCYYNDGSYFYNGKSRLDIVKILPISK